MKSPLDISGLDQARPIEPAPLLFLKARDGVDLGYREYAAREGSPVLVFFHGGGAHSGASYQHLAVSLRDDSGVTVVTPDLRGHGGSEGARGDSPSTKQMFRDVLSHIERVREKYPRAPIFLGGHSSGAGLVLNFSTQESLMEKAGEISGFAFVAPHLGFRAKTERAGSESTFATVKVGQFVLHSMSFGLLCGHCFAVRFNYPEEVLERDPALVVKNTVNVANALTPAAPRRQLRRLAAPLGVWLAEDDALMDPDKVVGLLQAENPAARVHRMPEQQHLGILLEVASELGRWVRAEVDTMPTRGRKRGS